MQLLDATAEGAAGRRARRSDSDDQVVGRVPSDGPDRAGSSLTEEVEMVATAVEVLDVKLRRGARGRVVVNHDRDPLVVRADLEHAAPGGAPGGHGRRPSRVAVRSEE